MAEARARFTADTRNFQSGVNQMNRSMVSLRTAVAGIGAAFAAIGAARAISSITNFGTQAVISSSKAAASFETLQVQFEVLIGDVTKANKLLKDMQEFGATTPLQLKDLQQSTKLLLAFGVEADDVMETLKQLGDISMGDAQKLESLARAFGKMSSAGKATMEDINIMIDAGFNPLAVISEKTGVSMSQLRDKVSEGEMSFETINDAIKSATGEGGRFNNMLSRISGTTEGKLSNLADAFDQLRIAFGVGLNVGLKDLLDKTNTFLPDVKKGVTELGAAAGRLLSVLSEYLPGSIESLSQMIRDAGGIFAALKQIIVSVLTDPAVKAAVAELANLIIPKSIRESIPGALVGATVKGTGPTTAGAIATGYGLQMAGVVPGLRHLKLLGGLLKGTGLIGMGGSVIGSKETSELEKNIGYGMITMGIASSVPFLKHFPKTAAGQFAKTAGSGLMGFAAKHPLGALATIGGALGLAGGTSLASYQEEKQFQAQKSKVDAAISAMTSKWGDFVYGLPEKKAKEEEATTTKIAEKVGSIFVKAPIPFGMSMLGGIRMYPSTIAKNMSFPLMGQGGRVEALKSDGIGTVGGMITSLARLGGGKAFAGTNNLVALQTAANGYLAQIVKNTQKPSGPSYDYTNIAVWG